MTDPLHSSRLDRPAPYWHAALICIVGVALLAGCWNAGFLDYDDAEHFTENKQLHQPFSLKQTFTPISDSTYFPMTLLSYRLDILLGNSAPGIRVMTLLYHLIAALVLWRLVLLLGLTAGQALFCALLFSAHPLNCETVCWISERKNALAALFCFAALWAQLKYEGSRLQIPLTCSLYILALASKPSALGFLPLFAMVELLGGRQILAGSNQSVELPRKRIWRTILIVLPLACSAIAALMLNLEGHSQTLLPPPGGTVFTALMTDSEIVSRYLVNILVPFKLSAVYSVVPIVSPGDPRLWICTTILIATVAASLYFAANRRRAILGWLWFILALAPVLNVIAIFHLMQDRYVYLSLPGIFIVIIEVVAGIVRRVSRVALGLPLAAGAYLLVLVILSVMRSSVWNTTESLFADAVSKQPKASFAHMMLGSVYRREWEQARENPANANNPQLNELFKNSVVEWQTALENCPDSRRLPLYPMIALLVGEAYNGIRDIQSAQKFWQLAAERPTITPDLPNVRATALGYLASLDLSRGQTREAYAKAREAVSLRCEDPSRMIHARAALAFAAELPTDDPERRRVVNEARAELQLLKNSEKFSRMATQMMQNPLLN